MGIRDLFGIGKRSEQPKPAYETKTFQIVDQDTDYNKKFAKEHKDDLVENDDYRLPKKTLLEDFDGRVYLYEPTRFDCQIKGNEVYDEDNCLVGSVPDLEYKYLPGYEAAWIVLYGGRYKFIASDFVGTDEDDYYFKLEAKYKKAEH